MLSDSCMHIVKALILVNINLDFREFINVSYGIEGKTQVFKSNMYVKFMEPEQAPVENQEEKKGKGRRKKRK